jgi:cellulose biosynthesis protein BcsQ
MGNPQNQDGEVEVVDHELARDVARLYSWANVEEPVYRSFVRRRKLHSSQAASDTEHRREEPEIHPSGTSAPVPLVEMEAPVPVPVPDVGAEEKTRVVPVQPAVLPQQDPVHAAIAVYSLAGGVGKTTLCANLGRIFCSQGERVLLVDASGCGLLPFYYGASDFRPGLRTFVAPDGKYAPVQILGAEEMTSEWLETKVKPAMQKAQRVIFDLGPASAEMLSQILSMCAVVLVPVLSDLNSILTISRIESIWKHVRANGLRVPDPFYVFNEFDEQDPIEQKARSLVARQVGERLLSQSIRYSAAVANAIADRMTVADHAPDSPVAQDYMELAYWLREAAPVAASPSVVRRRWSEQ